MAINIPIITEFSDAGLKSAQGAFNQFKTKIGEAEGAMGKLRAGSNVAFDAIKANAGMLATAGVAAIGAFAAKSIMAFNDLALSAGKFADATGLSVEESSRWTEVAGDLGIEAEVVQKSIDKMNKSIADSTPEWKALGAELAYTSTGAIDVNKTFLNTVDALNKIEDPTKRAELAAATLGKGWQNMAELIGQGSAQLEDSLASVSDAKVINEEELRRARDFRAALDNLADQGEDLAITLGGTLVPILADVLGAFNSIITTAAKAAGAVQNFMGAIGGRELEDLVDTVKAQEELNGHLKDSWDAYYSSRRAAEALNKVMGDQIETTRRLEEGWAELLGQLDEREAWRNLQDRLTEADQKIAEVFGQNTPEAMREAEGAIDDQIAAIARYVDFMKEEIPDFIETQILAALDQGQIDEARRFLEIKFGQPIYQDIIPNPLLPGGPRLARMMLEEDERERKRRPRPVGQRKPGEDSYITGIARDLESGFLALGGRREGNTVIMNVQGSIVSSKDIVEQIRKGLVDSQRNGAQLIYQNT